MKPSEKELINNAVLKILTTASSPANTKKLVAKHGKKVHFIPKKYRVFGGMLQSMNIQFGNFIEELMTLLIANEPSLEIISKYSGKKSNKFQISVSNERLIDNYITNCQTSSKNSFCETEFPTLLSKIIADNDTSFNSMKHDIDLLFKDKKSGVIYYVEVKYNDDHDTGKFVDINRKFIKTFAYLCQEFEISDPSQLVPVIFFFNNKKMKGNIYVPEEGNIMRGKVFFEEFLSVKYQDVNDYMATLSESSVNIEMFDAVYQRVVKN